MSEINIKDISYAWQNSWSSEDEESESESESEGVESAQGAPDNLGAFLAF